ncbi:hypothetical protein Tco_1490987 [Tanacetum coccineum]
MQMYEKCSDIVKMESSPLMNAMAVENVVENESHFSLKIVDQDLSSLAMFTKHLMGKHYGGRGGSVGSNSGVVKGKVESMGGIGGGSFSKCLMVAKNGRGGNGFIVDGGRSPIKSRKDREDGEVENKSSMGSREKRFVDELDRLIGRSVPERMAEFMKQVQGKDMPSRLKLQILSRKFELRAREKDIFIEKLKGNMDF